MPILTWKLNTYDASFNLNLVQFTHTPDNNWKTAAKFGISEKKLVQDWHKMTNK